MAPIHTARHVSASDATIPLFTIKGLSNLAPSTITTLDISGVPLQKQVAFTQYADNLASFIWANQTKKRTTVSAMPLGSLNITEGLPLNPPPVRFVLQKEINFEMSEKFVKSLGPGSSQTKSGKTTIYNAPTLETPLIKKIVQMAAPHYNCGRDAVTPPGLMAYRFLSAAITEFLKIHTYAAFPTYDKISKQHIELKTLHNTSFTTYNNTYDPSDASKLIIDLAEFSTKIKEHGLPEDANMELDDSDLVDKLKKSAGAFTVSGIDTVLVAKPSPAPLSVNVGISSAIPNMPGLLFPYFKGLIQPDASTLKAFSIRRLFQLMGDTTESCQEQYLILRRGLNSLATTDVGMELAHIILGIELALSTQGRCYVIIEAKQYKGFALLGTRFAIFDNTKWVTPVDEHTLRMDIAAMDPHVLSSVKLSQLFASMTVSNKYTGPIVTEDALGDPNSLVEVFAGLKLDKLEPEEEKELDNLLRNLNYMGSGYLVKNPQVIADALETMFSTEAITLARPTYIPSVRSNLSSRSFIILSRFGPEAFSMWNERGTLYTCEARETASTDKKGKRKLGEMDTFANMPEQILITPKPLSIAVKDMDKMIAAGGVKMDLKERAKKFRNIAVEAESMKKVIWAVLVEGMKDSAKRQRVEKKPGADVEGFDDLMSDLLNNL
jgi:hypothetical protein